MEEGLALDIHLLAGIILSAFNWNDHGRENTLKMCPHRYGATR
jgi:hypothetical protein